MAIEGLAIPPTNGLITNGGVADCMFALVLLRQSLTSVANAFPD